MTLDDLHAIGWRNFLLWAWNEPQMREQFTIATGVEIRSVKAPINAAIDAATGASESCAARFIAWATHEHWGIEHAPAAYRKTITAKSKAIASKGAKP